MRRFLNKINNHNKHNKIILTLINHKCQFKCKIYNNNNNNNRSQVYNVRIVSYRVIKK